MEANEGVMGRKMVNEGHVCRASPGSRAGRHFRLTHVAEGTVTAGVLHKRKTGPAPRLPPGPSRPLCGGGALRGPAQASVDGLTSQLSLLPSNLDCLCVRPPPPPPPPPPPRKFNKAQEASGHSQVKASSEDPPKPGARAFVSGDPLQPRRLCLLRKKRCLLRTPDPESSLS